MKDLILVTGGCGYIGSHTVVDLLDNGFDVISVDDNSRSSESVLDGIEKITGKRVKNYCVDLTDADKTLAIFKSHPDIKGIIHFAAYKTVPESVQHPLLYFKNNLLSLINLLKAVEEFDIPHFVFSSSCSVYGNADELPVTEESPVKEAESPYARTKQMGENIIRDFSKSFPATSFNLLRYFNPVGAHPTAIIGEVPYGVPNNLVPYITQTAIGLREQLTVYGDDYDTRDGTCIRDYIFIMDIAHAHTLALQHLIDRKNDEAIEIFNLGTGTGVTVLEVIQAFERANDIKLNYKIGPRRPGDVEAIYADNTKARQYLHWKPNTSLEEMMRTAWEWEKNLQKNIS